MELDPQLLQIATPTQKRYYEAIKQHGSNRKAAAALGCNSSTIDRSIASLRKEAARRGYSPQHDQTHIVPETQYVKGVSTYYNQDGQVSGQWVKTSAKQEELHQSMLEFVEGLKDEVPRQNPVSPPKGKKNADLLSAILVGDAHIGMRAWGKETLDGDFDTDIAVQQVQAASEHLIDAAPEAETGLFVNVGDWFHANDPSNVTPGGGNRLDVDGRHFRNIRMGAMCQRHCIDLMLRKHKKVVVINAKGNHDSEAAIYLNMLMQFSYEKEPRVEVQDTIGDFNYYRFGKCLIQVNHGDSNKVDKIAALMAKHRREDWGECIWKYCWIGHIHHKQSYDITELDVEVEAFRNLAPSDAWHAEHGYQSPKAMTQKTLHKEFGVISEMSVNTKMLEAKWKR